MPKKRGDRRTSKVKLSRILGRIGRQRFSTSELAAACKAERVKYDTAQRAMLRYKMIEPWSFVMPKDGTLPRGAPERIYEIVGWMEQSA